VWLSKEKSVNESSWQDTGDRRGLGGKGLASERFALGKVDVRERCAAENAKQEVDGSRQIG